MLAEINRRFAVEMLAQFRVHALAVIRVNPPIPFVERVADFLRLEAKHRFPLPRKIDPVRLRVPIPHAVARAFERELPAFVAFSKLLKRVEPLGNVSRRRINHLPDRE